MAHHNNEKMLCSYSFFKTHDPMVSEDLVQETFLKTWSYVIKGGKIHNLKAFLYHVLNNLIVDQYRKRKTSSLDVLVEKGFEPSEDVSEHIFDCIDGEAAILLIQQLPVKYQKVMN